MAPTHVVHSECIGWEWLLLHCYYWLTGGGPIMMEQFLSHYCPCPTCMLAWAMINLSTGPSAVVANDDEQPPLQPCSVSQTEPLHSPYTVAVATAAVSSPTESDKRPKEEVLRESLQMRLEEAYPNLLSTEDLIRWVDSMEVYGRCLLIGIDMYSDGRR